MAHSPSHGGDESKLMKILTDKTESLALAEGHRRSPTGATKRDRVPSPSVSDDSYAFGDGNEHAGEGEEDDVDVNAIANAFGPAGGAPAPATPKSARTYTADEVRAMLSHVRESAPVPAPAPVSAPDNIRTEHPPVAVSPFDAVGVTPFRTEVLRGRPNVMKLFEQASYNWQVGCTHYHSLVTMLLTCTNDQLEACKILADARLYMVVNKAEVDARLLAQEVKDAQAKARQAVDGAKARQMSGVRASMHRARMATPTSVAGGPAGGDRLLRASARAHARATFFDEHAEVVGNHS